MNNLIFTAATSSDLKGLLYFKMADLLIESLRTLGKFNGDILVYSDETSWFKRKDVLVRKIEDNIHPLEIRFSAEIDPKSYDNIMFLDCDILCIDNINDIFTANNEVLYVYEKNKLMSSEKFGYFFLKDKEKNKYKDEYVINAGTYCVDADYYHYFCKIWKEMWGKYIIHYSQINNPYNDQSMLNAILRRGQVNCRDMGEGVVEFPFIVRKSENIKIESLHKGCKFIHYNSDFTQEHKEADFELVREYYRKMVRD